MADLNALIAANAHRWAKAKLTRNFEVTAKRLIAARRTYQIVSERTGVPWAIIAVIHERECGQSWTRSIAQGDPWMKVSIHRPAGRGPFGSWEDAACDALTDCPPYAARNHDWSIGGALTKLEEYNGLGYAERGTASPYIWSGTDQYFIGKYISDGHYDPHAVDHQLGCAGMLMTMMQFDPSITFGEPKPVPAPVTSVSHPASGSLGAFIAKLISAILSIFKK